MKMFFDSIFNVHREEKCAPYYFGHNVHHHRHEEENKIVASYNVADV